MRTPWLDFYRGNGPDSEGRTLAEILAWSDDELEAVHDYIQWLFPLPEPSMFNADAPVLTPAEIAAARADASILVSRADNRGRACNALQREFYVNDNSM